MPIRRRRRVNLERGFRRVTWAFSLGILVVGALAVAYIWLDERATWDDAIRPGLYDRHAIYVSQLGVVRFPLRFSDRQIKEELDRSAPLAIEKAAKRRSALLSLRAGHRDYAEQTDAEIASKLLSSDPVKWSVLADVTMGDSVDVTLLPVNPPTYLQRNKGDEISHLYIPPTSGRASVLYTRVQAFKAEASGQREAGLIFRELGNYYDSPRPMSTPLATSRPLAILVLILIWVPWGVFFFGRWIARGFALERDEADIEHRRPDG